MGCCECIWWCVWYTVCVTCVNGSDVYVHECLYDVLCVCGVSVALCMLVWCVWYMCASRGTVW